MCVHGGCIPCSVHWFVVGKRKGLWDGSCDDTNHCAVCCTGTSEHQLPLTSTSVLQVRGELNGAQFLWCKSKPGLGGCATQMVCTVLLSADQGACRMVAWKLPVENLAPCQKNTLSFLSLKCFEILEHRTSYSKLLERNWRWLSLVLLTAVFAAQAPGCFSLTSLWASGLQLFSGLLPSAS